MTESTSGACHLSVFISSRLAGRERRHSRTVHWYIRWIPLTCSLIEAENGHLSKHTDLLPSRLVSSDGRKDFDRESASRSNEKSGEYYTRNLQAIWITCSAHRVSLLWRKHCHDVIGSSISLSVRPACERRAPTPSRCHQRLVELHPSFISPCYGLCASILYMRWRLQFMIGLHSISYKKYGSLIYVALLVMQSNYKM